MPGAGRRGMVAHPLRFLQLLELPLLLHAYAGFPLLRRSPGPPRNLRKFVQRVVGGVPRVSAFTLRQRDHAEDDNPAGAAD